MTALRGTSVGLLALLAGSLNASIIGTSRTEFRALYALAPNGRVVVQNLYGDVRITAWDRDEVLVQAIKHSADPQRLDDAQIVVDSSSALVSIRTQYSGSDAEHPASVEYRIMVPRTANLENIKLINGGLSLIGMQGPVKASSVNGSIRAERMGGQTELSTVNGHLEAEFQRVSKCHSISLTSVNGPIKLSLPSGAGATVSAHNLSGGIDADFGRSWRAPGGHRLEANVNGGGAQIRLHNVNGGISIHSTWSRRAPHPAS
jgi:DUF4097 and DUF4098 domain-containing protein YvlB